MSKFLKATAAALALVASGASAQQLDLGREATQEEVTAWDIDIRPDGMGLPAGSGTVEDGEVIFAEACAACHGDFGEGVGRWPVLSGGIGTLSNDRPVKTIGSYWPYLSTVWDYINRAMPFGAARTLTPDQVYAITAYLLYVNDQVDYEFELSQDNFTSIELPNEEGFYPDDRLEVEFPVFTAEACMTDCKDEVEITMRAAVVDVTPETEGDDAEATDASAEMDSEAEEASAEEPAAEEPAAEEAEAEAAEEAHDEAALDPELVAAGEKNFRKCKACHQVGEGAKNKTGPHLNDVFGRTLGGLEDFNYSKRMEEMGEEGIVWNEESLAEFLRKPRDYVKGTKMSFSGFKKDDDIEEMIAYLKSLSN